MAKADTKRANLVEQAKTTTPPHRKTWLDNLPDDQRANLVELRRAYLNGELPGWGPKSLYDKIVVPSGIQVGVSFETFRGWISDYPSRGK